jgi:hypothetical protein
MFASTYPKESLFAKPFGRTVVKPAITLKPGPSM